MVQGTLMRGTIHTVARGDYRLFLGAVARAQREWAGQGDQGSGEPASRRRRWRASEPSWPLDR